MVMAESVNAQLVESVARSKVRRMKRLEFERLSAEGFFDKERVELLFGVRSPPPLTPPPA